MFSGLETYLLDLIETLPLEAFVFIASFIEEVAAPVPSAAVLLATGSFAAIQNYTLFALIPLALIAALGKAIGAIIIYFLAERIGSMMITKFGRFFDIKHSDVENLRGKITGSTKDYFLLIFFRALPILPSAVVSIGCGILKIPFRIYIISTFIGTIIRDSIFLYIGYTGTELFHALATQTTSIESLIQIIILALAVIGLFYLYQKRRQKMQS